MMELEEMQLLWSEMSTELAQQKKLTDQIIIEMTKEKYQNKISGIARYESIGAVFCLVFALLLILNFHLLDTWYFVAAGIFSIVFYLLMPYFSLSAIWKMRNIDLASNNYQQTLIDFTRARRQFLLTQRWGIYLGFVLMIVVMPLVVKIMDDKNLFTDSNFLLWYIPIGAVCLFLFARWGYNCYSNITASAENLLQELDD